VQSIEGKIMATEDDEPKIYGDDPGESEDFSEEIPKEDRVLRTQAYDKSISDIVAMMANGDVVLDPEYQRNYVWDNRKASLLVESILLNVPIPVIYVSEDDDGRWNVVDGLQRLNSLKRFFDGEFKLRGLEVLTEINGETYKTLNPRSARTLRNGILRMILIFKESHPEIKYDIFMRLNRGAVKLNEQELRNCLYRGKLNLLVMRLRRQPQFLELIGQTSPHIRMADAELILRYFTLSANYDRLSGTINNYAGKMKTALNRFCEQSKNISEETVHQLETLFLGTVNKIHRIFGTGAFQRANDAGAGDGRLNRALMDCVMIGVEPYALQELEEQKSAIVTRLHRLPREDLEFEQSISFSTSDKRRVEYRLNTWCAIVDKTIREKP
jgi:hypothetical protein